MKKSFLEWLRELFPNDHAVVEQYQLSELQEEYPELYDDFKDGNSTEFAKLFIEKNIDWSVYDDARTMYEHQRQENETLKAQVEQYQSDDYVLVPKKPTSQMLKNGEEALQQVMVRNTYSQDRLESKPLAVYTAMLKAGVKP